MPGAKPCPGKPLFSLSPQQRGDPPPIQRRSRWRRDWLPMGRPGIAAARRRGDCRCSPAGTRGDRTPNMVSCPLLTPLTFLCAATPFGCAAKRGLRGLGSVRRAGFGRLLCPEFPLRYPPRITVRGHPVQSVRFVLRKAPLRSRVCPWSTRRPCGPLVFRRATEGSRVRGKMWGCQEGDKKPGGCLGPLLSPPPDGGSPRRGHGVPSPPKAATAHAHFERKAASTGCAAVSAERYTLC